MTKTADYLDANRKFLSDGDVATLEILTDDQFDALQQAASDASLGDPFEHGVVRTHETLDDFEASRQNHWTGCGNVSRLTFGGFAAIRYEGVQMARGEQRRDFTVIDFGGFRAALQ